MNKFKQNNRIQDKASKVYCNTGGISNLDLKETVKAYLGSEVIQKLFNYRAKNLVEEAAAPTQ